MNVRSGKECVDTWPRRRSHGLPGSLNVLLTAAGKRRNHRTPNRLCHRLDGLKVALRCDRESSFDDIHSQSLELMGKSPLLIYVHAATRRLLAIPQGGIEYFHLLPF
jgi:hypothetical protein